MVRAAEQAARILSDTGWLDLGCFERDPLPTLPRKGRATFTWRTTRSPLDSDAL
jgi:hypothetical protein